MDLITTPGEDLLGQNALGLALEGGELGVARLLLDYGAVNLDRFLEWETKNEQGLLERARLTAHDIETYHLSDTALEFLNKEISKKLGLMQFNPTIF